MLIYSHLFCLIYDAKVNNVKLESYIRVINYQFRVQLQIIESFCVCVV